MALDLTGQAIDNQLLSKVDAPIGTYRDSDLDIVSFNNENLGTWMLCDGQSCVGTQYETLTGKTNVPDFLTEGTFRRQAKVGRQLGSFEADENKAHSHSTGRIGWGAGPYNPGQGRTDGNSPANSWINGTGSTGGAESRPKNIACNVFIKVDHL